MLFHVFQCYYFNSQRSGKVRGIPVHVEYIRKMAGKWTEHGANTEEITITVLAEAGSCWGEVCLKL